MVNNIIIFHRIPTAVCSVLLILAGDCNVAPAQAMPSETAKTPSVAYVESMDSKRAVGYLHGSELSFLLLLPPYPALDSKQDKIDVATFRQMQVSGQSTRWKMAESDAQMTYARFSVVSGIDFDPA
jgi:hypothetical protein